MRLSVAVALLLLHDGVDHRRSLVVTPVRGPGGPAVLLQVVDLGFPRLGGPRDGESPLVEAEPAALLRVGRLLAGARAGEVGMDTVDDRTDPRRRYLRVRADPTDASLVVRVVDVGRPASGRGDWDDAPGALRITGWDWDDLSAHLEAWASRVRLTRMIELRPGGAGAGGRAVRRAAR